MPGYHCPCLSPLGKASWGLSFGLTSPDCNIPWQLKETVFTENRHAEKAVTVSLAQAPLSYAKHVKQKSGLHSLKRQRYLLRGLAIDDCPCLRFRGSVGDIRITPNRLGNVCTAHLKSLSFWGVGSKPEPSIRVHPQSWRFSDEVDRMIPIHAEAADP